VTTEERFLTVTTPTITSLSEELDVLQTWNGSYGLAAAEGGQLIVRGIHVFV